jgi:TraY domain
VFDIFLDVYIMFRLETKRDPILLSVSQNRLLSRVRAMAKAKRGRPAHGEYAGKTDVMSFRIRPDTKADLKRAAAASGRSLSQEAEHRLRRGLDEDETISSFWGDSRTLAMMQLAAQAVLSLGKVRGAEVHWTADAELFDAAMEKIFGTLQVFRPIVGTSFSTDSPEFSAPALDIIREAQAADPARPLNKSTRQQRAMARLKQDLGEELADRAVNQIHEKDQTNPSEKLRR